MKVLPKRFHLNRHTTEFSTQSQKLELHTGQITPYESNTEEISFERSHHRISFTDSKVRTINYIDSTIWKYYWGGFNGMVHHGVSFTVSKFVHSHTLRCWNARSLFPWIPFSFQITALRSLDKWASVAKTRVKMEAAKDLSLVRDSWRMLLHCSGNILQATTQVDTLNVTEREEVRHLEKVWCNKFWT